VKDNYFNYFTEIEEYFVHKRGKNILISPLDWCLVELWKENGIPQHVVLRGIDRSFEKAHSRNKRPPTTLHYCHPAVMEAFEEFQEATIGSHGDEEGGEVGDLVPRDRVLSFLAELEGTLRARPEATCHRTADRIRSIHDETAGAAEIDPGRLDLELGRVASSLIESLSSEMDPGTLADLRSEAEEEVKRYRKRLSRDMYEQLKQKYFENKVSAHFGLPDFSLLRVE
jgi:hypothetical protein